MLWEIPMIDTHVHRVHPNRAPELSHLGGGYIDGPGQAENGRQTLLYGMILEALRQEFAMPETATTKEIEQERNRRCQKNPQQYFAELVAQQNVAMYCLEIGSPIGNASYSREEIDYFNASLPEEKRCAVVRIDRVLDDLLPEKHTFASFEQTFDSNLRKQIQTEKTVGLKSCAAYNGGLQVEIVERSRAQQAYEKICAERAEPNDRKHLHNYMLLHSMDAAAEFALPVQFHTGAGGGNYLDFRTQNPVHLIDFLQHSKVKNRVKIVLLHGGHPHEEDTSYLTAQFANVYTDFSGMFYLCSLKGVERMAALLERTPLNKVMYGSDGVMFPEISWFSHRHFRKQLARLLTGLVQEDYLTQRRAAEVAKMFLYDNAVQCYERLRQYL